MPRRPAKSATSTIFSIQQFRHWQAPWLCLLFLVFVYKFCKLQQERHQQTQQTPATFSAWKISGATSLLLTSGMPAHVCAPFMLEFVMFLEWGVVKVLSIWFHMVFASCLELALPTVLDHLTWSKPVITLALGLNDPNVVKGLDAYLCYLVFGLILSSSPKIGGLHTRYTSAEKIEKGQQCRVGWEATLPSRRTIVTRSRLKAWQALNNQRYQNFCRKATAGNDSSSCNCTYREVL